MSEEPQVNTGHCLCGAVRYRATGTLRTVFGCHCEQCRRWTGHHVAATAVPKDGLVIEGAGALGWYRASPEARRGFCRHCGSSLFWDGDGKDYTCIMAGTLDAPTGLTLTQHCWTAYKGDYYALDADLPAYPDAPPARPSDRS